jgi:hypothetical protein
MKPNLPSLTAPAMFAVIYTHQNERHGSVIPGTSAANAWTSFQQQHPHVQVVKVIDSDGHELTDVNKVNTPCLKH